MTVLCLWEFQVEYQFLRCRSVQAAFTSFKKISRILHAIFTLHIAVTISQDKQGSISVCTFVSYILFTSFTSMLHHWSAVFMALVKTAASAACVAAFG